MSYLPSQRANCVGDTRQALPSVWLRGQLIWSLVGTAAYRASLRPDIEADTDKLQRLCARAGITKTFSGLRHSTIDASPHSAGVGGYVGLDGAQRKVGHGLESIAWKQLILVISLSSLSTSACMIAHESRNDRITKPTTCCYRRLPSVVLDFNCALPRVSLRRETSKASGYPTGPCICEQLHGQSLVGVA